MTGFRHQKSRINPEPGKGLFIFMLSLGLKDQRFICRAGQPAIGLNFSFKLPRRPSGLAKRKQKPFRSPAFGNGPQNLNRRGQADIFIDHQRVVRQIIIR